MNRIELPKQPSRPTCRHCTRCGGTATGHIMNGKQCVFCNIGRAWVITPLRGTRTKTIIPCKLYSPLTTLQQMSGDNNATQILN